jgi:RNA polymerase sigma-70 factor, ECF subfamily
LLCRQVVDAVKALLEAQRVVMILVAVQGFSYREAAQSLVVPIAIGAVMSRLSRGRLTARSRFLHRPGKDAAPEESRHELG